MMLHALKYFIVTGYTDFLFGLDTLASIIESKLGKNSIIVSA